MMIQIPVFLRIAAALLVGTAVILSAPQTYAFPGILQDFERSIPLLIRPTTPAASSAMIVAPILGTSMVGTCARMARIS